jgi:hypothetical protein
LVIAAGIFSEPAEGPFTVGVTAILATSGVFYLGIKAELETKWDDFEADIKTYIDNFGKQVEQQQAVFKDIAAAQLKAWREAADKFPGAAAEFAADTRADIDAAVEQMKANASEAEVRLQQLKQAGSETWVALSAALKESRAGF